MADLNDILRDALSLGIQERASLAEQILASLDEVAPDARSVSAELVHDKAKRILERS